MVHSMFRLALLGLPLLVVAFASAAPGGIGIDATPTFAAPVQLPGSANFAEPSLAVGPDGTAYAAAPGACTQVWRSSNAGAAWSRVSCSQGNSGDSDVAVDSNGIVYASDLFNNAPVSVSNTQASTFQFHTATSDTNNLDRQWIATGGTTVFATWRDGGLNERFDRSTDGGHTFSAPITVVSSVDKRGNIYAASSTDLYIPYTDSNAENIHIAVSHNAGSSWVHHDVAATAGGDPCIFPTVAKDKAGVLYVVWCDIGGYGGLLVNARISMAVSHDDGVSWSAPIPLSNDGFYNTFPWMLADAQGHVQVAWYEGQYPVDLGLSGDPNTAAGVQWYVKVASSTNADQASPTFAKTRATGVVHTGPICTHGGGCSPTPNPLYANRAFLDFFEMAELPTGKSLIVFDQDSSTLGLGGGTNLFTVTQTGGDLLK